VTAHQQREGGGFIVKRPIGGEVSELDPFLLLDHFGPVEYGPGEAVGAPDHPHRGFETVSYIVSGSMQHKDSAGNSGTLSEGWVQWMTAGSGVVHSEMPSDDVIKNGGKVEGFQLWVNLRAEDKMISPRYQDTPPEKIPVKATADGKVTVKVIAGESLGTSANIETRTPIMYLDIHLKEGASFTQDVPKEYKGILYVWRGSGYLGEGTEKNVKMGQMGVMGEGDSVTMTAADDEEMRVLLIAGEPLNENVVRSGPFVMNTWAEIQQAYSDYQSGKLGQIEGAEERYAATEAAKKRQKESGRWRQGDL
uniref:Pirin n=1 Tax=Amphimedon queenslandica TaxID=400682 RepID=A0A1X7SPJ8_AMPQE